ncbi:MAG: histidine kinase, partial [Thermoleophilia bacterium]|nr:histidine kinase [Thermoleophilia bacterium]
SHELRTPLTAISGFASTMTHHWETLPDADKQRFVAIIEEQSERLGRLVSDLLTLSHIESGRVRPVQSPVDLEPVVRRTLEHLGLTDIEVTCDPDIVVLVDEDHIEQILVNLLGNAMTHGAPPVGIEVRQDGARIDITVVDHGVGVPEEFVAELFTRFARGPQAGEQQRGGAGLGLSIVEGLAHAYGGRASYAPNEPRGARFSVRLPAVPAVS